MKKSHLVFLVMSLASLVFSTLALGDWAEIPAEDYSMKAPPRVGSAAYKKDFEVLLAHQEGDREEACELARTQPFATYEEFYFGSSLLSRKEYDESEDLVTRAMKYSIKIAGVFKGQYTRPRPYDADARIIPCARKPGGSRAYPSSHAAAGVVSACVLAAIYPEQAAQLKAYGKYLGDVRFMIGVHHPSDVAAGQKLGKDICAKILRDADFKAEVRELKN